MGRVAGELGSISAVWKDTEVATMDSNSGSDSMVVLDTNFSLWQSN